MVVNAAVAPTVGVIARRLGVPIHRVEYLIRSRNLQPVSRAGNLRVFAESDVDRIASELRRMDADRKGAVQCQ
jgi:DNA-binding transcriptional MerR regulator